MTKKKSHAGPMTDAPATSAHDASTLGLYRILFTGQLLRGGASHVARPVVPSDIQTPKVVMDAARAVLNESEVEARPEATLLRLVVQASTGRGQPTKALAASLHSASRGMSHDAGYVNEALRDALEATAIATFVHTVRETDGVSKRDADDAMKKAASYAHGALRRLHERDAWTSLLAEARALRVDVRNKVRYEIERDVEAARKTARAEGGGGAKAKGGTKPKKSFDDVMKSYKRYDPSVDGYGSPEEWMGAFRQRLSADEARRVLRGRHPREVLGVGASASWEDVRGAFRKLALKHHPDLVQDEAGKARAHEEMKVINAAYEALRHEFGK